MVGGFLREKKGYFEEGGMKKRGFSLLYLALLCLSSEKKSKVG